jgi:hypothetical protein
MMRRKLGFVAINRWVIHTELCTRARHESDLGAAGVAWPRVVGVSRVPAA